MFYFYISLKTSENICFLKFSEDIEVEHYAICINKKCRSYVKNCLLDDLSAEGLLELFMFILYLE